MILRYNKKSLTGFTDNILALSVFFLPLFQVVSLICWGILIVYWLISGQFKNTIVNLKSYPALILFISLYTFYLAGMLWSENKEAGLEDLGIKISLLIFPLLFSSLDFLKDSLKKISTALIAGCSVALIICLGHSISLYVDSGDPQMFFYTSFSFILHPTYFTMYLNLALLMICLDTFSDRDLMLGKRYIQIILFFMLITGVIVINARLAMTTVFLTLIIFSVSEAIKRRVFRRLLPRFIIHSLLIAGIFFSLIRFYNRFVQISDAINEQKPTSGVLDTSTQIYYNSTLIRIGLLKNGITLFKNNFLFGVGTGDVNEEFVKELNRSKLDYLAKHYTGAHNQYIQTAMSLGLFGLILLILCIIYPLMYYFRIKNYLATCFVIIVLMNALGDTILRASSLYFFSFFGCYLYTCNKRFFSSDQTRPLTGNSENPKSKS